MKGSFSGVLRWIRRGRPISARRHGMALAFLGVLICLFALPAVPFLARVLLASTPSMWQIEVPDVTPAPPTRLGSDNKTSAPEESGALSSFDWGRSDIQIEACRFLVASGREAEARELLLHESYGEDVRQTVVDEINMDLIRVWNRALAAEMETCRQVLTSRDDTSAATLAALVQAVRVLRANDAVPSVLPAALPSAQALALVLNTHLSVRLLAPRSKVRLRELGQVVLREHAGAGALHREVGGLLPLSYTEAEKTVPNWTMDFLIMPSLSVRFRSCCQAWTRAGREERRWLEKTLALDGDSLGRGLESASGSRHERACLRQMNPSLAALWIHLSKRALRTSTGMAKFLDQQGMTAQLGRMSTGRLSMAQLEALIFSHPLWLEALASFQYEIALGIVPAVLATVGLPELWGNLGPLLTRRLEQERALVGAVEFPWLAVAKTLGVNDVPDLWEGRAQLTKKQRTMLRLRSLKLELLGPVQICRAMAGVASRREMAAQREMLLRAARVFGENRGVRLRRSQ